MKNDIISQLSNLVTSSKIVSKSIDFIALIGSYREHEAIENYSDIDILFILKDTDRKGTIELQVLSELRKINKKLCSQFSLDVSFLTHTIFDFNSYVEIDYLTHYSWGEVFYGEQEDFEILFSKILQYKAENEGQRKLNICNAVIHRRFNCIRKYVSVNEYLNPNYIQFISKLFIDNLIEIADLCLIYNGHYAKSKKEIVLEFENLHFIKNCSVLSLCYDVRKNWNQYKKDKNYLDNFILIAVDGMQQTTNNLLADYELYKTNNNL
ncbi:nucleotidyltransferase domain-containing protein [Psychroflexus sp. CAK1W]|uniref:nucleotidyltransferase domain-containing protein n=1 Tax=Psychroflexus curvus TaxID=2873595 RepID=UPI001CCCE79F|nr:nucleotidyltransferase domain-containing protein [Psychroflexus curvus]MBZ9628152.1 nucleotidyltransferase domain-containing protein [Psychroflexus curvus]